MHFVPRGDAKNREIEIFFMKNYTTAEWLDKNRVFMQKENFVDMSCTGIHAAVEQ
jgi:hypothetical protein